VTHAVLLKIDQSSVCLASRNPSVRDDAAGAINGLLTGTYGFHTGHDDPP
jgi:hypothetical protein